MTSKPPASSDTPPARPLGDLAEGPGLSAGQKIAVGLSTERRVLGAAFAPLHSNRLLAEGIEGGAFAAFPLALAHGGFAVSGLLGGDLGRLAIHGLLTVAAILAYYAVLKGRSVWPSVLVLAWLLVEIGLAPWLLGYRWGGSIFNWIGLPLAILGIRASWKRRPLQI